MEESARERYIAEEAFMIQHSGEIPEVAFHNSIYHLTTDPDGPQLILEDSDRLFLKRAVVQRYQTIIRRDLELENRDKSSYRGLGRCLVNWKRLSNFCLRESIDPEPYRSETAEALLSFLHQELADVQSGRRLSSINCPRDDIIDLAGSLGITLSSMPTGWQVLCPISLER